MLIKDAQTYAESAQNSASQAMMELANYSPENITYGTINPPSLDFTPAEPIRVPNPPNLPAEPDGISIATPDRPPKPSVTQPSKPGIKSIQVPSAPAMQSVGMNMPTSPKLYSVNIPNTPSLSTPTMATIAAPAEISIAIPDTPSINFNDFTITAPTDITLTPKAYEFSVSNIDIEGDSLYQAIRSRLIDNVRYGGTGLLPSIENDIFNRDLERNEQQLSDSVDKTIATWSKTGFTLPDGMLAHSIAELQKEYENKRLDRSREIAIKQAELEQANIFKSMEIGTSIFLGVKELMIKYEKLSLEIQEYTAKYYNEFIRLQIEIQNSRIEVFKARVAAYEADIRLRIARIEVFKAQVEAELAKVRVYDAQVSAYKARIDVEVARYSGILQQSRFLVDIFNTQVNAEEAKSRVNESIIREFSASVEAEVARMNGVAMMNKANADMYASQINGAVAQSQIEEARVRVFSEEIRAFVAKHQAYSAEIDGMRAECEAEKAKAEINVAKAQMWKSKADAMIAQYMGQLEGVKASNNFNLAIADIANSKQKMMGDYYMATANINQGYLQMNWQALQHQSDARLAAIKGVADLSANLAAGAMAALNAGVNESYSESRMLTSTT